MSQKPNLTFFMMPAYPHTSTFSLSRLLPQGRPEYYRAALTALRDYARCESISTDNLTPEFINGFIERLLKSGKSQHTVAAYFRALRAIYNSDVKKGICHKCDAFKLTTTLAVTSPETTLTEKEISTLADSDFSPLTSYNRVRDLILFSFHCRGLEISEILRLKTDCVNNQHLVTAAGRFLITSPLAEIIERYHTADCALLLGNSMPSEEVICDIMEKINRLTGLKKSLHTVSIRATWESIARSHRIDPEILPDNAAARLSAIITRSELRWWAIVNNDFDSIDNLAEHIATHRDTFIPRLTIARRTPQGIKHRPDPSVARLMFVRATRAEIHDIQQRLADRATVMYTFADGNRRYSPVPDYDMHIFRLAVTNGMNGIEDTDADNRPLRPEQHVAIVGHPLFDGLEGYIETVAADRVNVTVRLPFFKLRFITPKIRREFIRAIS